MKKFLSIILAVLLLVPLFAFNVIGAEEAEECTASERNCAQEANFSFEGGCWYTRKDELVDGDKTKGLAGSYTGGDLVITMAFDEVRFLTDIVVTVNSEGTLYAPEKQPEGPTNANFSISVKVFDKYNDEIVNQSGLSTLDKTEISIPVNAEAKTIIITSADEWDAYKAIWEIETFEEIGKHAWVLDEDASTPASCEDTGENVYNCACGATKEESVNAHTVEEWEVILAPTTLASGVAEGKCVVPGCDGYGSKILPRLSLNDHEIKLGLDKITIDEDVKEEEGTTDITKKPHAKKDAEALFDGIIDTNAFNPTNFWCGTGWSVTNTLVEDDPATPDVDETQVETIPYHSTLTITFDQLYTLTKAELYVYSNYNNFKVDFLGADGLPVKTITKSGFQNDSFSKLNFTSDIYGMDVKSIVITVQNAKWEGGKGLSFTEFNLAAHECVFSDEDIENGTTVGCVTTFSGTCTRCTKQRTDVKIVEHTWEKDATNPTEDKIVETISEVSCYRMGRVKKHCTACNTDVSVVLDATGAHVFGETITDTKPTCGAEGVGHQECTTEGCSAKNEGIVLPPEGAHSFKWVEKEGFEADYTHEGVKINQCSVCQTVDEASGTQTSKKLDAKFVSARDWSIRYTDFTSPKATFRVAKSSIEKASEQFDVKIFGVVKKGDVVKEVQVYGEGATGNMMRDGTFSLVVQGGSYTDEYEFSVRVEITDKEDGTNVTTVTKSKPMTTSTDGIISAYDVAFYYLDSENRASNLDPAVKELYEGILASNEQ